MMTLDEMKLAVCEKLPELILVEDKKCFWRPHTIIRPTTGFNCVKAVCWPTEGLQVCHEAEKLLSNYQKQKYGELLQDMSSEAVVGYVQDYYRNLRGLANIAHATYEQRLEALCRVWWSERFN